MLIKDKPTSIFRKLVWLFQAKSSTEKFNDKAAIILRRLDWLKKTSASLNYTGLDYLPEYLDLATILLINYQSNADFDRAIALVDDLTSHFRKELDHFNLRAQSNLRLFGGAESIYVFCLAQKMLNNRDNPLIMKTLFEKMKEVLPFSEEALLNGDIDKSNYHQFKGVLEMSGSLAMAYFALAKLNSIYMRSAINVLETAANIDPKQLEKEKFNHFPHIRKNTPADWFDFVESIQMHHQISKAIPLI